MATTTTRTESDVQRAILDYLSLRGIFAWRANTGAHSFTHNGRKRFVRYGTPGCPDILGVLPGGRFLGVECKRPLPPNSKREPTALLSDAQRAFRDDVIRSGGVYVVATSIEDVEAATSDAA